MNCAVSLLIIILEPLNGGGGGINGKFQLLTVAVACKRYCVPVRNAVSVITGHRSITSEISE